jgi:excisionase family DNA binding protein
MEKFERVLLRVSEAAEMIGVSRSKLYEMVAEGVLPAVRLPGNRLIRIPAEAVRRLAAQPATAGVGKQKG